MRIAFYAPMKPPDHPVPSGDRRVARLFMAALEGAGHEVILASSLRSWQKTPDEEQGRELATQARRECEALSRAWREGTAPQAWFTYHLYYKAPDLLGPTLCHEFQIPYVVAEASVAPKRATGPWSDGHALVMEALERATGVISLNPEDGEFLPHPNRNHLLRPFLDPGPYERLTLGRDNALRQEARQSLAAQTGLDPDKTWLLAVAMMRVGDKMASYRKLASACAAMPLEDWQLIVIGDGPERQTVEGLFAGLPVWFLGAKAEAELAAIYGLADLFVWPAIKEAFGMALLEAQAAGLPAVVGEGPGVATICRDGLTGLLVDGEDEKALAMNVMTLIQDPSRRLALSKAARQTVQAEHSLAAASRTLDQWLQGWVKAATEVVLGHGGKLSS